MTQVGGAGILAREQRHGPHGVDRVSYYRLARSGPDGRRLLVLRSHAAPGNAGVRYKSAS